jgi:pyrrolysine biosynthesis protein PylD
VCHNSEATAAGFVAALGLMAGGMSGRKVLVLGCGAVGSAAAFEVMNRGGLVSLFDTDSERSTGAAAELRGAFETEVHVCENLSTALAEHELLIEATDSTGVIGAEALTSKTWIAAPGMPLGLTDDAATKAFARMIHDPLQIGIATMAVESAKRLG